MFRRAVAALLLGLSMTAALPAETLPRPIAAALASHQLDGAGLSIFVQAVDGTAPLLAFNEHVPRSPASVIKLLTSYAALDVLGPAYTWKTEVLVTGPVRNGRLEGDLVLRGGGDPGLTTERFWTLLREVRARGIREIAGDLVIDDTLFAPNGEDPGDFDSQRYRAYNVLPSAVLVNSNTVEFRVMRDAAGVSVYVDPPLEGFRVENQIGDRRGPCSGFQRGVAFHLPDGFEGRHAVLSGSFPTGCTAYSLWRSVLPAPEFADALFRALWRQLGGSITGGLRIEATPADAQPLLAFPSLPLNDQVRAINKWSNNPMTRHLLLTLGLEHAGPPATPEKGRAAVDAWLKKRGLEMPGLLLDNGSGLSRDTRVTAAALGNMLLDAWDHPQMADFMASMPIAARDGTLRRRHDGDMAGRLSLKTGRLDDVSAIAGLVQSRSGERYVAVVILNAPNAHRGIGEAVHESVLRWVFGR
ncbi:D-alanyl-D-alanine carboxypeptidase/D-alanyl-D-alanine-endopeptidase [Thioalkalivibrio sp. XN279]|uniref:D-alanyl-D-alanine carboxypeptidase/D-alanyl-D-alanine endopeptidase n=1 Tax=Thioalkalivibrio sp. XN279 TaxID=2714953 RepID=UPI00140E7B44|nr:D-alanyl-D-alanine carboxypeptidase/D-alanyl-D-alanine-endopeptidase [Thioalkalivibrio sp. XN279]NHA14245.1 D-alanyl-D-alanine carboxypeptidase/D-alanyl-D-alanine-endopeptidase [Thioalkalivibrio sp. XN279]